MSARTSKRDRALAGDDAGIVIRVDDDEPALLGDFHGAGLRLVQTSTRQDDFGAEGLGIGDFHEGRVLWHHDGGGDAQAACVIGDGLGVVAGRHGDHAPARLAVAERGELHERTTILEGIGELEALAFDVDLGAGQLRQLRGRDGRRADDLALEHLSRRLDLLKADMASLGFGGDRHQST